MTTATEPVRLRRLYCSCCGASVRGRQWWNRDDGHGCCRRCFKWVAKRQGFSEARRLYGRPGTHHTIPGELEV